MKPHHFPWLFWLLGVIVGSLIEAIRAYSGDGVYYYGLALRNSLIGAVLGHFVGPFVRAIESGEYARNRKLVKVRERGGRMLVCRPP